MKTKILTLAANLFIGLTILVSNFSQAQETKLPLIAAISITNPTCENLSNGEIVVTINGGFPPYTVNGIEISGNEFILGAIPLGDYQIDITDLFLSSTSTLVTLVSPTAPQVSAIINNVTTLGGSNGSIDLTVNSQLPVSYEWTSNGVPLTNPSDEDQFNLSAGWYRVLIAQENGCQVEKRFNVLETPIFVGGNFVTEESVSNNPTAINVHPNPSYGDFTIKFDSKVMSYSVVSMETGTEVMSGTSNGESLNFNNVSKGTYVIYTQIGNETQIEKIIVR